MLPLQVFDFVMELEGGERLTDDPHDPGGLTRWGISQRAHPSVDIRALTREAAHGIYDRDYWRRVRGDDLPLPIGLMVFDAAVNQGAVTAVKFLQRAVGVSPDGVLGPVTMNAVAKAERVQLLEQLATLRINRYLSLDNAVEEAYERGWITRVIKVLARAVMWAG